MRRTSGPQNSTSNFYLKKNTSTRVKSPNIARTKSRGKLKHETTHSNAIPASKNHSYTKAQQNQSSTFYTNNANKQKKSTSEHKKAKDLKKYQKQIMEVLNNSAALIQREWRKYLVRKYRKAALANQAKAHRKVDNQEFDTISGKTSQYSQVYNNKKYYSYEQPHRKNAQENSFNKNLFCFNLSGSKVKKQRQKQQFEETSLDKIREQVQKTHQRARSDLAFAYSENNFVISEKSLEKVQSKHLEIAPNIVNLVVVCQQQPKPNLATSKSEVEIANEQKKLRYDDHYVKQEKQGLDEIIKKLETKLEEKRLRKILALENSFSSNLMTFRSYQKNIENISEHYKKKVSILENKKKRLLDNFNQLLQICDKNIEDTSLIREDQCMQLKKSSIRSTQNHHLDLSFNDEPSVFNAKSIALEEWDLDAQFSDKKLQDLQYNFNKEGRQVEAFAQAEVKNEKKNTAADNVRLVDSAESTSEHKLFEDAIQKGPEQDEVADKFDHKKQKPEIEVIQFAETPEKRTKTSIQAEQANQIQKKQQPQEPKPKQVKPVEQVRKPQSPISSLYRTIIESKSQAQPVRLTAQQVELQLSKYHPIDPNIDSVNTWLLQISHYILDNYPSEFLKKITHVEQPPALQLFRDCFAAEPKQYEYSAISQRMFRQFQFHKVRELVKAAEISNIVRRQHYESLTLTFHQALYDCLNRMLLDELIEGRHWINYPWCSRLKVRKLVGADHAKQSLEKAINRVSNVSDYNLQPPSSPDQKYFEYSQYSLIFAEEIKQLPMESQLSVGALLSELSQQIYWQIVQQQCRGLRLLCPDNNH